MPRILVVDDDLQIRQVFRRILENAGYEVDEAEDGRSAVLRYRIQPPDLILLDIIMPEQEGLATIIELKKSEPGIKIIAISGGGAMTPEDYLSTARLLGAALSLEKPVEATELLEAVASLLNAG